MYSNIKPKKRHHSLFFVLLWLYYEDVSDLILSLCTGIRCLNVQLNLLPLILKFYWKIYELLFFKLEPLRPKVITQSLRLTHGSIQKSLSGIIYSENIIPFSVQAQ